MNWKLIEAKLYDVLARVAERVMQGYAEQWVSAATLAQHIEIFTPRWLERNGSKLPRIQPMEGGKYMYPLHKIQKMMQDGSIKELLR